jgi:WD40 repeat protein
MFIWVRRVFALVAASLLVFVTTAGNASAGPPSVVWVAPNPGMLATNAGAVAWSPSGTTVATGLADRWMRIRQASNGTQTVAILQPHRSGGVVNLAFSDDSKYVAVGNQSGTGTFNVYTVSNGTFLGALVATIDSTGILRFTPMRP